MATKTRNSGRARPVAIVLTLFLALAASAVIARPARLLAQPDAATPIAGTPGAATPATPVAALPDFAQLVAERPAEIIAGSCEAPGETVVSLTALELPAGEARGQGAAIEAERSYTSVDIPIDALLDAENSIRVLLSADESDVVLACGEIGGVLGEGESVVIKLSERTGSGFSGIAFLSAADAGSTGISVFLAGQRSVAETRELPAATPPAELETVAVATPAVEPTPTAEPVQVVDVALLEWLIDMPRETRAGQIDFAITNEGAEAHSLVIDSGGTTVAELPRPLDPGDSTVLEVTLLPGDYTVYCPLDDGEHREQGMESTLTVAP